MAGWIFLWQFELNLNLDQLIKSGKRLVRRTKIKERLMDMESGVGSLTFDIFDIVVGGVFNFTI